MKIKPKDLEIALSAVKPAVSSRSAVEALAAVRLIADANGAFLEATDMELAVEKQLPAVALPHEPMEALISFADLHKQVKLFAKREVVELTTVLPEATEYQVERARIDREEPTSAARVLAYIKACERLATTVNLVVSDGKRTLTFPGKRLEDWPNLDWNPPTERKWLQADGRALADIIARTEPVASRDETRPILTGVLLDLREGREHQLIATDSYRLIARQFPPGRTDLFDVPTVNGGIGHCMTIPARLLRTAAKSIAKAGQVSLSHVPAGKWTSDCDDQPVNGAVMIDIPDAGEVWRARLVEGQYPNYTQLLPEGFDLTVRVPKSGLADAANVAMAVLKKNEPTRFCVNGDVRMRGQAVDGPSFEEIIEDASHTGVWSRGGEFEIGFNPEYLRDVAKTTAGDELELCLISPLRPGLFRDGDDLHLLMPIRLNV